LIDILKNSKTFIGLLFLYICVIIYAYREYIGYTMEMEGVVVNIEKP